MELVEEFFLNVLLRLRLSVQSLSLSLQNFSTLPLFLISFEQSSLVDHILSAAIINFCFFCHAYVDQKILSAEHLKTSEVNNEKILITSISALVFR